MGMYDQAALTELTAIEFTGTAESVAEIMALCNDARADTTESRVMRIPGPHGQVLPVHVGDWVLSPAAGLFVVYSEAAFAELYVETP